MGQDVSNVGIRAHATAGAPIGANLELWHHLENEGLDDSTPITRWQAESLIAAAAKGQGAFDSMAGALAPWYAFPTLTGPRRDAARAACRAGVLLFHGLKTG